MFASMRERVAPYGLTTLQFTTLSVLSRHGAPLSTSQLARRAFMTPQSMSEVIHALERKGLIKRNPHPNHRRTLPATITPKGRRVLSACDKAVRRVRGLDARGLLGGDRAAFLDMVTAAVRNLGGGIPGAERRVIVSGNLKTVAAASLSRSRADGRSRSSRASSRASRSRSAPSRRSTSVSLDIATGWLTCLIGPNGAGKSTLLGCISGFHLVDSGVVRIDGRRCHALASAPPCPARVWRRCSDETPARRARRARQRCRRSARSLPDGVRGEHAPAAVAVARAAGVRQEAREALEVIGLDERANGAGRRAPAGAAPAPRRRTRARTAPVALLLDKPAAGLRAGEKARLIDALRTLSRPWAHDGAGRARHAVRGGARGARRRAGAWARHRRRCARPRSGTIRRSSPRTSARATL